MPLFWVHTKMCVFNEFRPISAGTAPRGQPIVARHAIMPPRNTATWRVPSATSTAAACAERLSVRQTMTSGRPSAASAFACAGNSPSGMLRAPAIWPSEPANSSGPRTSTITGAPSPASQRRSSAASTQTGAVDGRENNRARRASIAISTQVDRVFLQQIERHDLQRRLMRAHKLHLGRLAGVKGLLPARRAQAPAIAGLEAREADLRHRGREIVAGRLRENEELGIDMRADRVHAKIVGAGVAAAGAVKPGHRVRAAFCEWLAQHVAWPGARPAAPAGIGTGSIG